MPINAGPPRKEGETQKPNNKSYADGTSPAIEKRGKKKKKKIIIKKEEY